MPPPIPNGAAGRVEPPSGPKGSAIRAWISFQLAISFRTSPMRFWNDSTRARCSAASRCTAASVIACRFNSR